MRTLLSLRSDGLGSIGAAMGRRVREPILVSGASDAGQFFIRRHVHDFELFCMQGGIGPEREFAKVTLLHFDQKLLVFIPQTIQHRRMNDDPQLEVGFIAGAFLKNFTQLALNFDTHGESALHHAAAFAIRAIVINGGVNTLGMALPRHLHQAKL